MWRRFKVKPKKIIIFCLVLVALVFLFRIGYGVLQDYLVVPDVLVPDLHGRSIEEAESILAERGLGFEVRAEVFNEDIPAGSVVAQDPAADRSVRIDRVIELTISLGQNLATVPYLLGRSELEVRLILDEIGLELDISTEFDEDVLPGYVIRQDPSDGFQLPGGETVYVILSSGKKPFPIREFRGWTLQRAQDWLFENDLVLRNFEQEFSDDLPEGQIISQYPRSGEMVQTGDSVDFVISLGREYKAPSIHFIQINPQASVGTIIRILVEDEEGSKVAYEGMYLGGSYTIEGVGSGQILLMERHDDKQYYIIDRRYFP